jgi:hypothetical protein
MDSMIGTKIVLWQEDFSSNAYIDQLGISHSGYVVTKEFVVVITEERDVKGTWAGGTHKGWKGVDENGKIFTCNWNHFPDDAITPTYYWDIIDDEDGAWQPVDAIQAYSHGAHVNKNGNRKRPKGSMICKNHNVLYIEKCWKCESGYFWRD